MSNRRFKLRGDIECNLLARRVKEVKTRFIVADNEQTCSFDSGREKEKCALFYSKSKAETKELRRAFSLVLVL